MDLTCLASSNINLPCGYQVTLSDLLKFGLGVGINEEKNFLNFQHKGMYWPLVGCRLAHFANIDPLGCKIKFGGQVWG